MKKDDNFIGKRKPAGVKNDNWYISKEDNVSKIKIEHKAGDFSFRLWCGAQLGEYYEQFTKGDFALNFAQIFNGIKFFIINSIQNPTYYYDWLKWNDEYHKAKRTEISEEEDQSILDEMKEEHDATGATTGEGEANNS